MVTTDSPIVGDPLATFYMSALDILEASRVPFLVGGTFAYARYTGIDRETKDLDIFVRPEDVERARHIFEAAGYHTDLPFPHWLAKVKQGEYVMDLIFSSGNGVARVDDEWFAHAAESEVLGRRLQLCPIEEILWSKAFVQERERFDGGDVLHLLREAGRDIDWSAAPRAFRGLLAGAARAPRHVPLRLSRSTRQHTVGTRQRSRSAPRRAAQRAGQPRVLRHAALA